MVFIRIPAYDQSFLPTTHKSVPFIKNIFFYMESTTTTINLPDNAPFFALLLAALLYSIFRSLCVAKILHKEPHVLEWEAVERDEVLRDDKYNELARRALKQALGRARL
jgi:hypothetical protein